MGLHRSITVDKEPIPCIGCICMPICKSIWNNHNGLPMFIALAALKGRCSILKTHLTYTVSYNKNRLTKVMNFYEQTK